MIILMDSEIQGNHMCFINICGKTQEFPGSFSLF